ncbi:MAG TPA: DnaJ domain-containing protein [Thermoanaerobaculia bacterium]|nr:DnaJ domain-containing protein [Thermoanaerobaculia bacterium]
MSRDFYAILGVPKSATSEEIRKRFLSLTRERHPDRFQGEAKLQAERSFQEITQAFSVLLDPARRRDHDAELVHPGRTAGPADPAEVAKVFLQRGVKAYKAKNYLEAADNFRRAAEAERDNPKAWHYLARACSHQSRWLEQAREAIERACALDPMRHEYHKLAGEIFARSGNPERAIRHFRQALRWGGEDSEVQAALAELTGEGKKRKSLLGSFFGR